jgi:LacI family transcriptional regulator
MKKKTTIYNIANQAKVSTATVSRVLNESPLVSQKTRNQVQAVINQINFSPDPMARGLNGNATKSIGIILPDISNLYFSSLFLEIERYAMNQAYSVVLFNTMFGSYARSFKKSLEEPDFFKIALAQRLDGIIITGGQIDMDVISPSYLDALNRLCDEIPVVIIGQKFEGTKCVFIERNLERGIFTVMRHFYNLGHRKIGFLGGEVGVKITSDRFKAYKKNLTELGLEYDEGFVHFSDYYVADGYSAMRDQLRGPLPTAIIAMNDMVALGAVRALNDAGLLCPKDIAIASCDQFLFSEYTTPRITSLDEQNDYLGRLAIVELINLIQGHEAGVVIPPTPCLIIRESSGCNRTSP